MEVVDAPGGARVLRALAAGERCALLLGHLAHPEGAGAQVVLKLVTGEEAADRAGRELAALERAAGEHAVRALDVAEIPGGYALLIERLTGPTLAELLAARQAWEAGEAVTLVAPLAAALQRMHAAGVAHGALGPAHVVLSAEGSPTLVGFGAAELFPPGLPEAELALRQAVLRDREGLRAIAVGLLSRIAGERAVAARGMADELAGLESERLLEAVHERLFSLAAPRPVVSVDPVELSLPGRLLAGDGPPPPGEQLGPPAVELLAGVLPDGWAAWLRERLAALPGAELLDRLPADPLLRLRSLAAGRARLLLTGAVAGAVLLIVLLLLPPSAGADRVEAEGAASPPADSSVVDPRASAPSGAAAGPAGSPVTGDDPVAAAVALLAARELCLRELSALCLEAVDEPGSAALARDRAAIRTALAGGGLDPGALVVPPGAELELAEELGGSAIVRAGPDPAAAAVLLVRGEAGWRLRELIPQAQAD